ncbi:hypothetical protein Bbelb_318720 [Branchiostoma belcheri]|nr:hypothetical protein Bbelb_318720 [Branchiostoma belcheri]
MSLTWRPPPDRPAGVRKPGDPDPSAGDVAAAVMAPPRTSVGTPTARISSGRHLSPRTLALDDVFPVNLFYFRTSTSIPAAGRRLQAHEEYDGLAVFTAGAHSTDVDEHNSFLTKLGDYINSTLRPIRTNNDVEGWHQRLKHQARRGKVPFYMLVNLLKKEADFVTLQVRAVSDHRLGRYQRRTYRLIQAKPFRLWDEYASGKRTTTSLLRSCARLYTPNPEDSLFVTSRHAFNKFFSPTKPKTRFSSLIFRKDDGVETYLRRLKRICQDPIIHLHPARLQTALNRVVKAARASNHKRLQRFKDIRDFFLKYASSPGIGHTVGRMVMTPAESKFAEEAEKAQGIGPDQFIETRTSTSLSPKNETYGVLLSSGRAFPIR